MNLLNKLTIKNLKLNKKRTIVTIIGIILAVALLTAVSSMYASLLYSLIKFETTEKGDFHVAYYDVDVNDIDTFKNNRQIEAINITKNVGYAKINSKNKYKPYAYVKAFTRNSLENLSVKIVEGRIPLYENEIIIPTHLKTNGRLAYNVGDDITLDIGRRVTNEGYELDQSNPYHPIDEEESLELEDGEDISENIVDTWTRTYKIVGIMERPASNVESYQSPGYTFITYLDKSRISGKVDLYTKYTKEGYKNAYEVTAKILGINPEIFKLRDKESLSEAEVNRLMDAERNAKYEYNINDYLIQLQTDPIKGSGIGGLGAVVVIVIGIIIFTSVFCIKNSFDISITEKIKQYGMLRSIGATKKQIRKNVFYEASILGVFGIPLGVLSGILASYILVIISNHFLKGMISENLKLYYSFSWIAIVASIILGIVTIYFSAFRSARRASKVSPIDSIRNSAEIKIKAKKVKSPKIIKKIFGIGGDISYKNLKRNRKKYRTTVLSIVISVFVFIALTAAMDMAFDTVASELETVDYHISLYSHDYTNEDYSKLLETVKLDNIEDYTLLRGVDFEFDEPKQSRKYLDFLDIKPSQLPDEGYIKVVAVGDKQYRKYVESLGLKYEDIKDKGIIYDYVKVGRHDKKKNKQVYKTVRRYAYEVGDTIKGTSSSDKDCNIEIGYVTDKQPFGFGGDSSGKIFVSDEEFNKISKIKMVDILFKSNNPDKLQDDIDELLTGVEYELYNVSEDVKMMNNLYTLVAIFLYGFIIVISLIGITNIFNTITTNMELRKQEFAMLKSVGMTNREFNRMIRLESLFMGVKSLAFGIPIGIILSYMIFTSLADNGVVKFELPIIGILISIVAVFLLISVIMKYSLSKINKQNTIETIRNENI